jgi:hypothetical protein
MPQNLMRAANNNPGQSCELPENAEKERGAHPALLSDQSALTAMTSRPL